MNKKDLNRKIQILEEQKKALLKVNKELFITECEECAKLRVEKYNKLIQPFREWQQALDLIEKKYYY